MQAVKPLYFNISYLLTLIAAVKVFFYYFNHPDEYTSVIKESLVDEFDLLAEEARKKMQNNLEAKRLNFEEKTKRRLTHVLMSCV